MTSPTFEKYKVLVVDDVGKNLQLVGNLLKSEDVQTYFALNGANALVTAERNKPDLILLDISMPDMDGYEVAEKLKAKESTRDIPIIFLTARTQSDEILKGFDLGAVDYITKPFNSAELLKRVRIHLELKKSKDIIEEQNSELLKVNDMKDKMFSIIAHDLRGPVGNFKTLVELLASNDPSYNETHKNQILALLKQNAAQTFNLLENLLNWSRTQRGVIKTTPELFDMNSLIGQIIDLLSTIANAKDIKISNLTMEDIPVYADKNMVSTILRNLISNAIKFTKAKGRVNIAAYVHEEYAYVKIEDTGIGIRKSVLDKLFDNETLYSTRGTDNEKGSGIGLSLCKEFTERSSGKIWVESEVDKGTIFTFTLPINQQKFESVIQNH